MVNSVPAPARRRILRRLLAVVAVALPCAATAQSGQAPAVAGVAAALQNYIRVLRLVNSDSSAALFTTDGEMLQAGQVAIHGRDAIRTFLRPFDGSAIVDSASATVDHMAVYDSVAYVWASYYQRTRIPPGAFADYRGRFVSEWHLGPDHAWRIARILMQPAP